MTTIKLLSLIVLLSMSSPIFAWQFPSKPMDAYNDCKPGNWISTDEGDQYKQKYEKLKQLGNQFACDKNYKAASNQWLSCYNQYFAEQKRIEAHYESFRAQAEPRFNQALRQCVETARYNGRVLEAQKDQERQQRIQQQQAIDNQRRQSATQEAQQTAYQRDIERMQREREREQARQPRVIAQASNDSAYMNQGNRNEPRIVQTPQYVAQQQALAEQARQQQRLQEQEALKGSFKNLADSLRAARQNANSSGADRQVGSAMTSAETNAAVNAARGGSPVVGAIAGSALATTGAKNAETLSALQQATRQMDQVTSGAGVAGSRPATSVYQAPLGAGSADKLPQTVAGGTAPGPQEACGKRVFLALQRCVVKQCESGAFPGHPMCTSIQTTGSPSSNPSSN